MFESNSFQTLDCDISAGVGGSYLGIMVWSNSVHPQGNCLIMHVLREREIDIVPSVGEQDAIMRSFRRVKCTSWRNKSINDLI